MTERVSFPKVVQYRLRDTGEIVDYPPKDGSVYSYVIHDLEAFNELTANGELRDPRHTGRTQKEIVDNRNAPQ